MNLNEWAARHEVAVVDDSGLPAAVVLGEHGRLYGDDAPRGPRLLLRLNPGGEHRSRILAGCRPA